MDDEARGSGGGEWRPPAESQGLDRTPPQDVAAEQCVLGGMILSKDAIADVVEVVRSADFYRPAHATIFDTILDLYGRGEPADAITVAAALEDAGELAKVGGGAYLHTLMSSVPTAANASYYARIVADRAKLRRLVEVGTRIVQMGYGSAAGQGRDVDDVVDMAQQSVYDLTERRSGDDFAILSELLQPTLDEIEAGAAREEGVLRGVPTGFADLDKLLNGLHPGQLIIVAGRPGLGKALALDTPLPTPTGWTTMGEVRVGDRLLGADGLPTRVTALSEIMVDRPCYEVEFSDGTVIVADAEHRWLTRTRRERRSGRTGEVRTTEELRATLRTRTAEKRRNHTVTNTAPLQLPAADLLVAPYALGVWLGAGQVGTSRFVCEDREVASYVEADGYVVRERFEDTYQVELLDLPTFADRTCAVCGTVFTPYEPQWTVCGLKCSASNARCDATLRGQLRSLGVLTTKYIPEDYLRASDEQRRDLLAGLADAAGSVGTEVRLRVVGLRLADGVAELLASLGYRCSVKRGAAMNTFVVAFSTTDDVFRVERKRLEHKECKARPAERYIVDVRPVPSVPVRCVSVDNDDHLYLAGRSMVPTHNSTVSMDFARNASVHYNLASAIFSLEMSRIEIVTRLLSAEARVPLAVLRSGRLSDDDWTRLARRMGEISEAPIFVDDTPNMTLMEIRAKARRMRQRHDLKLVVVDYLQLMTSPRRVENRQQEVAELSRGLKLLAKEINCPVIAVSQLNRGPEQRTDKRPQLSDLRESGSIEQDADVVILLHRDDYYDKESPRAGEADFIVAKHRNGPTDTVTVAAQLHYSRFMDMAIS